MAIENLTCGEFLNQAGELLAAREAEHCLMLGLCSTIVLHPEVYPDPWFGVAVEGMRVVGAALQTPPHNVILSEMDPATSVAFADAVGDRNVPGVLGSTDVVDAFVASFCARTGETSELQIRERIFRADRVIAPRSAPGTWRTAEMRDRAQLVAWLRAFSAEAMPLQPQRDDHVVIDRWLRGIGKTLYVWEDGGALVSFAGAGGDTPRGTRIGPVYTPPELRGRGYASQIVAAATQAQLDGGRTFCFLFTDLANPTSNKIYQELGYRAVTDVQQYRFVAAPGALRT